MMKKLIVLGIVVAMAMGFAAVAQAAYDVDWAMNVKASTTAAGTGDAYTSSFRTKASGNNDGKGAEDSIAPPGGSAPVVYGYTTVDGFDLVQDYRTSFTGTEKVWDFQLSSARFGTAPTQVYLFVWNAKNTTAPPNTTLDFAPLGGETIRLYSAQGGVRGELLWTVDGAFNGTGNPGDANTWQSGAVSMGNRYQIVVSSVPEPGSMLAMLSGLVGLAGFAIRRKR